MAASDPLDEILKIKVDESAINDLVGSLESQLASPTLRDLTQQNLVTSVNSNHIDGPQVVLSQNSQTTVNRLTHTVTSGPGGVHKHGFPQSNAQIVICSTSDTKGTIAQPHVLGTDSIISPSLSVTPSNTSIGITQISHPNISSLQRPPLSLNSPIVSNVKITPGAQQIKTEKSILQGTNVLQKQVIVSLGSNNPTNVMLGSNVLGGRILGTSNINGNPNINITSGRPASVPMKVETSTSGSNSDGSGLTNTTIYNFASIAAEQQPLVVPTTSGDRKLDIKPDMKNHQQVLVNVLGSNTQKPQVVVKQETSLPTQIDVKPELKILSQPQVTTPGVNLSTVLKTSAMTPASTSVITITKPLSTTQTVTVLRPPVSSQGGNIQHQQIQILNVNNTNPPRLSGIGVNPKTLAPRVVPGTPTIRIAASPQQPQVLPLRTGNMGTIAFPPGFQLSPGSVLMKNEQGQLMVLPPGQVPTTGTSPIVSQPQKMQLVRPAVTTIQGNAVAPPQTMQPVVSVRQPISVTVTRPQGPVHAAAAAPVTGHPTSTMTVTQPGTPVHNAAIPHAVPGQGQPTSISITMADNVRKCKNFLSTLIKLASTNQSPATVKNVKELIQGLIDGGVEPENFTARLQMELKSSPQPYLVPFLKKNLPLLRQYLLANKMHIEGIRAPPPSVASMLIPSVGTAIAVHPSVVTSVSGRPPPATGFRPVVPEIPARPNQPNMQQLTQQQLQHLVMQQRLQIPGQKVPNMPNLTKTILTKPPGPLQPTTLSGLYSQHANKVHISSPAASHRDKRKYDTLKEDDDINDVATMGGVNLSEESRNILATNSELMAGQLRSCKDENFLHTQSLLNRMNAIARKHGLEDLPQNVASLVSHATQERLRNIVEKLALIAEHRLEIYKTDSMYEVTGEARGQLKFLEELDRMEKRRHEEAEREVLLRAAKSRSKNEDPEQLKLKEKAKALQQAELEEVRQREANLTALAAIGPRKKRKIESTDTQGTSKSSSSATAGTNSTRSSVMLRPRIKRVNLRDLIFLLEQEQESNKSNLLYKAFLK